MYDHLWKQLLLDSIELMPWSCILQLLHMPTVSYCILVWPITFIILLSRILTIVSDIPLYGRLYIFIIIYSILTILNNASSCVIMATLVQPKWFVVDRSVGATISEFGLFRKYFLNLDRSLRAGDPDENEIWKINIKTQLSIDGYIIQWPVKNGPG